MAMVLAAGLMAAAGCGGDDEDNGGSAESTTPPPAETTPADTGAAASGGGGGGEKVSLTEFKITPKDASVKAGKVTFDVSNDGSVPHALEIEGNGAEEKTDILTGGQKATLEADLKPGTYEWYCPVGDPKDRGMKGEIVVGGGSSGSGGGGSSTTPEDSGDDKGGSGDSGY